MGGPRETKLWLRLINVRMGLASQGKADVASVRAAVVARTDG